MVQTKQVIGKLLIKNLKNIYIGFYEINYTSNVILERIDSDKFLFNNLYKEIDNQLVGFSVGDYNLVIMLELRSNLKKNIRVENNSLLNERLVFTNINYHKTKNILLTMKFLALLMLNQQIIYVIMLITTI